MFLGEYFIRHYRGRFYAKAQNLVRPPKAGAAHAFEQTGDRPKVGCVRPQPLAQKSAVAEGVSATIGEISRLNIDVL